MLTEAAETALQALHIANDHHPLLGEHLTLLQRARQVGVAAAYAEQRATRDNPLARALTALVNVTAAAALAQVVETHPILLTPPALRAVLQLAVEAGQGPTEVAQRALGLLVLLLHLYAEQQLEGRDPDESTAVLEVYEQALALADAQDEDGWLSTHLRQSAAWVCNTLGNYHDQHDHTAALAAYDQGVAFDPDNAMLRRNRARAHLALGQLAEARTDMDQAERLEPQAARLPELKQQWQAAWEAHRDA